MTTLLRFEIRRLIAARTHVAVLTILAIAGAASIVYGTTAMRARGAVLDHISEWTRAGDNLYFETRFKDGDELGRAAYYLRRPVPHRSAPLSALALGQLDLHPYFLAVRIRGLYGQLFDSDLGNPLKALAGNFDLSFVIVFLVPLAFIGMSFNLLSRERESGSLCLVRASPTPLGRFLAAGLAVRLLFLLGLSGVLVVAGFLLSGADLDARCALWLGFTAVYLTFWCALIGWVVSWDRSSALTAVMLVGCWLALTVIGPAALNVGGAAQPDTNGALIAIGQRQAMNAGWDRPAAETHRDAARLNPLWESYRPGAEPAWAGYFEMHEVGDAAVEAEARDYFETLRRQGERVETISSLLPPVATQLAYDRLAGTDMESHLEYFSFVAHAHRDMKNALLPDIIRGRKLTKAELLTCADRFAEAVFTPSPGLPLKSLATQALITLLLLALAARGLRRVEQAL
ncbi:MAG: DUF3526 domain-containing protein [Armatimonadetes bacterium]|nr:DUF3526 domain-containing protein [Armatimonadota bacterium]